MWCTIVALHSGFRGRCSWPYIECGLDDITMGEYACDPLSPWERQMKTAQDRRRHRKTDEIQSIDICEAGRSRLAPDTSQSVAPQGHHNSTTLACDGLLLPEVECTIGVSWCTWPFHLMQSQAGWCQLSLAQSVAITTELATTRCTIAEQVENEGERG